MDAGYLGNGMNIANYLITTPNRILEWMKSIFPGS